MWMGPRGNVDQFDGTFQHGCLTGRARSVLYRDSMGGAATLRRAGSDQKLQLQMAPLRTGRDSGRGPRRHRDQKNKENDQEPGASRAVVAAHAGAHARAGAPTVDVRPTEPASPSIALVVAPDAVVLSAGRLNLPASESRSASACRTSHKVRARQASRPTRKTSPSSAAALTLNVSLIS
jgi:hypothetical protein